MWQRYFFSAITLIFLISSGLLAQTGENDEIIKIDVALVNIPFSVSDREGRAIPGLKIENFTLQPSSDNFSKSAGKIFDY